MKNKKTKKKQNRNKNQMENYESRTLVVPRLTVNFHFHARESHSGDVTSSVGVAEAFKILYYLFLSIIASLSPWILR